jgi:hypothetical protein
MPRKRSRPCGRAPAVVDELAVFAATGRDDTRPYASSQSLLRPI